MTEISPDRPRGKHCKPESARKVLSVAVPSYNVERYLADSLASYCAGDIDDRLEVIIVDDGSTDLTPYIAREFVKLYPDIFRIVSKKNGGHGSAINAGIEHARGTYFRVIDGDDRICTATLPTLLNALENADEDLVLDLKREVNMETGASRLLELPQDLPTYRTLPFDNVCTRPDIEEFFMIHSTNVRTDLLLEHGISLLEHTFYVDYEFIVKLASYAETVRFVNVEACNYYVGNAEQSVAPANYVKRWGDHTRVTEELLRFVEETPLDPKKEEFVRSRVQLLINTHYNIALIYDTNRSRGRERARQFRAFLAENYPDFHAASEFRYRQAQALHFAGVDARKLDKIMGRG